MDTLEILDKIYAPVPQPGAEQGVEACHLVGSAMATIVDNQVKRPEVGHHRTQHVRVRLRANAYKDLCRFILKPPAGLNDVEPNDPAALTEIGLPQPKRTSPIDADLEHPGCAPAEYGKHLFISAEVTKPFVSATDLRPDPSERIVEKVGADPVEVRIAPFLLG